MIELLYCSHNLISTEVTDSGTLTTLLQSNEEIFWINVAQPNTQDIDILRETFAFHPLALEDIHNQEQRPKVEEFTNHLFMILNPVSLQDGMIVPRELDVLVGKNYMVTVHQQHEPLIEEATKRIDSQRTPFDISATYLLYIILDALMDSYLPLLEAMEQTVDALGNRLLSDPSPEMQTQLLQLKQSFGVMWWVILPKKDIINTLTGHHLVFIDKKSKYYLRDVDDHLNRIMAIIQMNRDNVSSLINLYVASVSNQLNQTVTRLTIFTIIVGTLAVLSGLYGMNFEHTFPPFDAVWGIPFVLLLMIVITTIVYRILRPKQKDRF